MDWTFFDRQSWINNAEIPDGLSNDGKKVKADKLKSLLHKILGHLGEKAECWPSQARIAEQMSVSVQTVHRATEALQNMSLLIVQLKNRPGQRQVINHYRVIWSELLLLDDDRARAFRDSITGKSPDQSDLGTDQSDLGTDQSDLGTDQSDTVSAEHTTNYSENKPKNTPPSQPGRSRRRTRQQLRDSGAPVIPAQWQVVVRAMESLGVKVVSSAVASAIARGLSVRDAMELVTFFVEYSESNEKVTPAWLKRWVSGESDPPAEFRDRNKPPEPVHSSTVSVAQRDRNRAQSIRTRIVRDGRKKGVNEDQMATVLSRALVAHGLPPDLETI